MADEEKEVTEEALEPDVAEEFLSDVYAEKLEAMLSAVLRSQVAIDASVRIMRASSMGRRKSPGLAMVMASSPQTHTIPSKIYTNQPFI